MPCLLLSINISFLRIWSQLLNKSLMENFIFRAVVTLTWKVLIINISTEIYCRHISGNIYLLKYSNEKLERGVKYFKVNNTDMYLFAGLTRVSKMSQLLFSAEMFWTFSIKSTTLIIWWWPRNKNIFLQKVTTEKPKQHQQALLGM